MGNYCVRGLGPRPWWYIPETGIYHHSTLTRKGRLGPRSTGGKKRQNRPARPVRACDLRKTTRTVSRNGAAGPVRTAAAAPLRLIIGKAR